MFEFLTTFFASPWMLLGLAALVVPPLIHLLSRRRFDVVDWGAMQFLEAAPASRRRVRLDDIILMLLRMLLVALLVFVAAGPFLYSSLLGRFGNRPPRDVVVLIDGSTSMAATLGGPGTAPADRVAPWLRALLDEADAGTAFAVLLVRDRPTELVAPFERDAATILDRVAKRPAPGGTAAWPEAVRAAREILARSAKPSREIVLVGDGLRHGFTDAQTRLRWDLLAAESKLSPSPNEPRKWLANLAPGRAEPLPNGTLANLSARRPVVAVGQSVAFRGEIASHYRSPPTQKWKLLIDGRPAGDFTPAVETARPGVTGFTFSRTFAKPGTHLVTVAAEPDPARDALALDDVAHTVVEVVPAIRVLILTGDPSPESPASSASFLCNALAPAGDPQPAFTAGGVAVTAFTPAALAGPDAPRVLVLHDVPRLSASQLDALTAFADAGGGVLVAPGGRADLRWYADAFFRNGSGPLPALPGEPLGDDLAPWRVEPSSLDHPLFGVFGSGKAEGLLAARFPRARPLTLPDRNAPGRPLGLLSRGAARLPFFIEAPRGRGRVILAAVPFDATGGDLVALPAFVPLVREIAYRLAAVGAPADVAPGRPFSIAFPPGRSPNDYRLTPPDGLSLPLAAGVVADTLAPGAYRVDGPDGATYRVVAADPREGDLTPGTADELAALKDRVGLASLADVGDLFRDEQTREQRQDLAWLLLLLVLCLLCGELWLTRRHSLRR